MIIYKVGNILEAKADALVNTVNTVGVMGKGIALQFKNEFPENYKEYTDAVNRKEITVGKVQIVPVNGLNGVKYVVNFPTKAHWRYPSKMEWIKDGLKDLHEKVKALKIESIAVPPLGCGNGGLNWEDVKPIIVEALSDLEINVFVYEPSLAIKEALKKEEKPSAAKLTPARAMLLYLLYKYRALGEFASEFAAEKLSYFLQRFGETQLKLDFKKGLYGPYSGKVRHVLYALNGYYIKGYEQKEAKPFETLELVASKRDEVKDFIDKSASVTEKERLDKVAEFIQGFESPYGLELLATVDFLSHTHSLTDAESIKKELWSQRKKDLFPLHHIQLAINHLDKYRNILYSE
ncbi:macro domain-containing protein [Mucilaginibacter sp.]|uniref:type II toxin-antitoxin system antitoxin DNA ADP-ribosyl glycohydrolase DarG n=1 Tax=Mucilaginibacter sp. TaxID=1882438 RepID=UPI00284FB28A|nr:macro domain-containing protein [Mucilaginibacter sp.]MDR3697136.1 macro domain-containing protein [Mucilaginibacter sp.]